MIKILRPALSSIAAITLVVGALCGAAAQSATAATQSLTTDNITYTVNTDAVDGGATVTSYSGPGGAVSIPPTVLISGVFYRVTGIGSCVFCNKNLTSVTIPEFITTIGDDAFRNNSLTTLKLPDSLRTIGDRAFSSNQLTSIRLLFDVATIGAAAFGSIETLTTVVFEGGPPTITAAGVEAGSFGSAVGKVIYANPLFNWDFGSLWNGYTVAAEPNPVAATVGDFTYSAFTTRPSEGATVTSYEGAGGAVIIPDRVTILGVAYDVMGIGDSAFENKGLTSVKIPAKVTTLDNSAFAFNSLQSVTIPAGVTTLGAFSFLENDLTSITIPYGMTRIRDEAFQDNQLTAVTIPTSVTYLGFKTFAYNRLTEITIPGSVDTVDTYSFAYNWIEKVSFSNGVTKIGPCAFEGNRVKNITLPASLKSIGFDAFNRNPFTSALFMGPAPTVTTYGQHGPFGKPVGKTIYYLAANRSGFTSPWTGYATVVAKSFTSSPVPTITGTKTSGSTLTAVTATWNPSADVTFSYVWNRATSSGGAKTPIPGATTKTYRLVAADKGKFITVTVTASKVGYADTTKTSADGSTKIAN